MNGMDPFLAERELDLRVKAAQTEVSNLRALPPKAGGRLEGLALRGRWLLAELGYRLVVIGARLDSAGQTQ